MRWQVGLILVAIATWGGCAKQEPEPAPNITAERLGESTSALDDGATDATGADAMDELDPHPDDSVWAALTPAERQALSDQGYEIHIDEADREALRAERENEGEEAKGGSLMDHVGRASMSVAAVAISLGMMVAPFFLM
jgi:hypothetical protein